MKLVDTHGFDKLEKYMWTWIETDLDTYMSSNRQIERCKAGSSKASAKGNYGWIDSDAMEFRKLASRL